MSKVMGVDWGEKKSGIAVSDELGITARPLSTIKTSLASFRQIFNQEKPALIVFGRPREMDGSLGQQAQKVDIFVKKLKEKTDINIIMEDETNTTRLAKGQMIREGIDPRKNRDLIDQKAAQIILEGYLNENKV